MGVFRFGSGWVVKGKHGERKSLEDGRQVEGQSQGPFPSTNPGTRDSQVGSSFAGRDPPARWDPSSPTAAGPASRTTELWRVPQPQCFWDPALAPAVTSSWGHRESMRSRAMRAIHSFDKFRPSGYYLRSSEWTA